jgi:hypothetical protein
MDELGIDRQVGHPAAIRAAEPRKQKHDGRDALLLLQLQIENRFPSIWVPSRELRDLHALLRPSWQWCVLQHWSVAWFQVPCAKQWLTVGGTQLIPFGLI